MGRRSRGRCLCGLTWRRRPRKWFAQQRTRRYRQDSYPLPCPAKRWRACRRRSWFTARRRRKLLRRQRHILRRNRQPSLRPRQAHRRSRRNPRRRALPSTTAPMSMLGRETQSAPASERSAGTAAPAHPHAGTEPHSPALESATPGNRAGRKFLRPQSRPQHYMIRHEPHGKQDHKSKSAPQHDKKRKETEEMKKGSLTNGRRHAGVLQISECTLGDWKKAAFTQHL